MRLVSYQNKGRAGVGVMVSAQQVVCLDEVAPDLPRTMRGLLSLDDGLARARDAAELGRDSACLIDGLTLDPVVTDPHAIWCLARNYKAHADEIGVEAPTRPMIFHRVAASQVGHLGPLVRPVVSEKFDYEGELAVVIGRGGRHIAREAALDHVAGYACYNDGSVRDWQRHSSQIGAGKNFAGTGAFGPWLVTPDEAGDIGANTMVTRLNGVEVQSTPLSEMIFGVEELVAYFSTICPLVPGDVIVTGTPGGVGLFQDPPRFLRAGDVVEVEISNIGILRNTVQEETLAG
ncbi:5-carboxymethyl-2-hydroxymuconate isomerase [Cupriavidus sp. SK-4]|uniref:fumarylacetoacetate hydrolase family protein n=1 Tax=Cupriavidus sp. SK-4 TaxID=574750 RepID=UPI00044D2FB4|nr:fumarylacetoacetate hydrolase family protein [Cupriavidus sp. SK-4]EYS84181.1 5-carboxymethyl-2-hydroxymuconate isomerase [Cupriavidus sp. SK-4]